MTACLIYEERDSKSDDGLVLNLWQGIQSGEEDVVDVRVNSLGFDDEEGQCQ